MPGRCFRKRRVLAFVLFSNRLKFSTFFASNNVENNFYLFDEYIARYLSHITTLYSLYPLCLLFVIQVNLKFELIPEPGSTSISSKISIAPRATRYAKDQLQEHFCRTDSTRPNNDDILQAEVSSNIIQT